MQHGRIAGGGEAGTKLAKVIQKCNKTSKQARTETSCLRTRWESSHNSTEARWRRRQPVFDAGFSTHKKTTDGWTDVFSGQGM